MKKLRYIWWFLVALVLITIHTIVKAIPMILRDSKRMAEEEVENYETD